MGGVENVAGVVSTISLSTLMWPDSTKFSAAKHEAQAECSGSPLCSSLTVCEIYIPGQGLTCVLVVVPYHK